MKAKVIVVKTIEDLERIKGLKSDKVVVILNNDLDLKDIKNFKSINLSDTSVIIYGRGHTIKNLNIDGEDTVGMFSETKDLYVRDVVFDHANINGKCEVGMLAGHVNGNLDVKGSLFHGKVTGESFVGAVCGTAESTKLESVDLFAEIKGEELTGSVVGLTRNYKSKRIGNFTTLDVTTHEGEKEYGVVTGRILKK